MTLEDTKELMCSPSYKDRFKAEYYQLKIRYLKLMNLLTKWDRGELNFTPTCRRGTYELQLAYMSGYLSVLEDRAELEGIILKEVVIEEVNNEEN